MIDFYNDDIKALIRNAKPDEFPEICSEIREFLLEKVSKNGGHLASNLGVVELTIALHRVYDTPNDKIIFDVGHQAYVHKIITGRAPQFDTLRKYKGLSGFPKSRESVHDAYDTGHSSTSISAAAGMACARDYKNEKYNVVAVIGDGSMTGGMVYEALNSIGSSNTNVKIVLNDNGMSIAKNVGALSKHLSDLSTTERYLKTKNQVRSALDKIPVIGSPIADGISKTKDKIRHSVIGNEGILFEELGIKYIGPVDGSNITAMENAFKKANSIDGPSLVHVITTKGKGYEWAEKYPRKFHGIGPFNIEDGNLLSSNSGKSFSTVFGETITDLASRDMNIVTVVAAMGTATGLGAFYDSFPERFIDVGIAEEHAVSFAAGLAKSGMKPVVAIYSSFLQRAFDQIIEDVCLQNLHVVFAIDRAGLVGADGETHHGQFDLSYLQMMPNMTILAPSDGHQLAEMLEYALNEISGPVAIRYPRGSSEGEHLRIKRFTGQNIILNDGKDVTILAVGTMLDTALIAASELRDRGMDVGVRSIAVIKPFDESLLHIDSKLLISIEDNAYIGGFGELLKSLSDRKDQDIISLAIPDSFIPHGSVSELQRDCHLSSDDILAKVSDYYEKGK